MAVLLYSNGIVEEYKSSGLTFTEEELVKLFNEFDEIKTYRLTTVLNTWCICGISSNMDATDFNKIASDLAEVLIYSHVLYVHDSELDPGWNATDSILYKNYSEFVFDIKKEIDKIAANIVNQFQASADMEDLYLPYFETIGITNDIPKRVLFGFNPTEQTEDFYKHEEFYKFSKKVYDYLIVNKQEKEPFVIYADKKAMVIVAPQHVVSFLNNMLEKFKSKEDYEICTDISNMIKTWKAKTKKTKKLKSSDDR